MSHLAAEWYARNYPLGPKHDWRFFAVLAAWEPGLYNLPITGKGRLDGGFRPCGDGMKVHCRAQLSTFDNAGLTRLVLAAHRYTCRVELSASFNLLVVFITPRQHEGDPYTRHPNLDDLVGQASHFQVHRPSRPISRNESDA